MLSHARGEHLYDPKRDKAEDQNCEDIAETLRLNWSIGKVRLNDTLKIDLLPSSIVSRLIQLRKSRCQLLVREIAFKEEALIFN
jgi:hypothetical protein